MTLTQFRVDDAEPLPRCQAQDADLALVQVAVDLVDGFADIVQREDPRKGRVDLALGDQAVGLPRLAVVGEVRADDASASTGST